MAGNPEERELIQRQAAGGDAASGQEQTQRGGPGFGQARDIDDPREEEGWTQPESSAQKGAEPDVSAG